jgi:hypothetical protein
VRQFRDQRRQESREVGVDGGALVAEQDLGFSADELVFIYFKIDFKFFIFP